MDPWEYKIQVVIPHCDTIEPLAMGLRLWSLQTIKPYICVVDTGTDFTRWAELRELVHSYPNAEIQFLEGDWFHPSEPVSTALDFAAARCQQEFQFHTHTDVFPTSRELLWKFAKLTTPQTPVVGYEISPRDHVKGKLANIWQGMVGHTATMLHMPTIDRHRILWKLLIGHQKWDMDKTTDTEVPFNLQLRELGITPKLVGHDVNFQRQVDQWIDHVRSYGSSKLWSSEHYAKASVEMKQALKQAEARAREWESA